MKEALVKKGDRARATTFVAAPPDEAFEVFTTEIELWWGRGPRFRFGGKRRGTLAFEPGVGGRLFEIFDDGPASVFEVGRVLAWEPGARLLLEWRLSNFAPGERTEVEVLFEAAGGGTRVSVEHRGWSSIREDHPARHGQSVAAFLERKGRWWGDLVLSLRAHVRDRHDARRGDTS